MVDSAGEARVVQSVEFDQDLSVPGEGCAAPRTTDSARSATAAA